MFFSLLVSLTACGGGNTDNGTKPSALAGEYDLTIWVSEVAGVKEKTQEQIDAFEAANPGVVINATVEGVGEGDAATQVLLDVASAPDLFCFAQDQLTRLVQANALAKLGQGTSATVKELNDAGSIKAASVAGDLYAFPLTSDNGYFMYYDKSVISEDIVGDLDAIVAACEAAKKNISYELENGWYTASFFFATGCKSEWATDENGEFTAINDTFNSEAGLVAMKAMQKLVKSPSYVNSSKGADFQAAVPSAVVISGTWDAKVVQEALGANYGAAKIPSINVNGTDKPVYSMFGYKYIGVNAASKFPRAAQMLANYLAGEECQLQRAETLGWGPSNLKAAESDVVKNNATISAVIAQSNNSVAQADLADQFWDPMGNLGNQLIAEKTDPSDAEFMKTLLNETIANIQDV